MEEVAKRREQKRSQNCLLASNFVVLFVLTLSFHGQ
jgi:hypothetical protein